MNKINGIQVPTTADSAELRAFVQSVYKSCGCNYTQAAALIGVHGDTVRKLLLDFQQDSQVIRDRLDIKKTKTRPRVWMPTNNCDAAMEKLLTHYERQIVFDALVLALGRKGILISVNETIHPKRYYENRREK